MAPTAVAVLRQAAAPATGDIIFPGRSRGLLGEGAVGALYARAGFGGRHVPHGWRASFSTILNEKLGDQWAAAIDRTLSHAAKNKVEAAYNRAERIEQRRMLFEEWARLLTPPA